MTLDQVKTGSEVGIVSIPEGSGRLQLIRMGISEGSRVICQRGMSFGPVVLKCRRQEIAIGRPLARTIHVK